MTTLIAFALVPHAAVVTIQNSVLRQILVALEASTFACFVVAFAFASAIVAAAGIINIASPLTYF